MCGSSVFRSRMRVKKSMLLSVMISPLALQTFWADLHGLAGGFLHRTAEGHLLPEGS